ncbi:hypothetical protein [Demequina sp.]|uniref:hypothetical protein n=1 Tax=Demequina sp. TaxID=2050685 RepID=UPI003D101716
MTFETPPDAVVAETPQLARPSGRKGLVIGLILALVGVVALGGLSAYLWSVHSQYVAQNEQLRDEAATLGTDVATERARVEQLQAQLDETAAQLETAKDTINGLANSEAQAGDDRQALIDVADGLQECASARQDLIDHLNESYKWTAASLAQREADITTYCKKVTKAYNEILDD